MATSDKTQLFESTPIPRAIASLAIPTVMSSLVMVLYNLADTFFVGMLNNPVENAAVTLAAPVLLAFNAVNNLFGVGSSSMMSRALGRKDYDTVYKSSAFGFYCSLICGALFSLFYFLLRSPLLVVLGADAQTTQGTIAYLNWTTGLGAVPAILNVVMAYLVRSEGSSLHASIGTMSGCLLNIVLDPIFILPWGFHMGAAGAGLATCISNCVACLYFFVLLWVRRGHTYVCIHPKYFTLQSHIVKGVCGVGVPASIQNLLNVTGMTVLNNFTAPFGANAVAAIGIAQKINMVPMYVAMGLSQGLMPLVSYNFASKNYIRMRQSILFTGRITVAFLAVLTSCYFFFSHAFISMFMSTPEVVAYGSTFLRAMCLALPFFSIDFLAVGVFQACGLGRNSLIFAILRKIVLEIPALYILNQLFPLYGLAWAQFCAEIILCGAAVVTLSRLFRHLESSPQHSM